MIKDKRVVARAGFWFSGFFGPTQAELALLARRFCGRRVLVS